MSFYGGWKGTALCRRKPARRFPIRTTSACSASFDRLLIAQALEEKLPIVTADPVFRKYGVKRIW